MHLNHKAEESYERCSSATKDAARPVLEDLSGGFRITWFREVEARIWTAVLKPTEEVSDQFGLRQEYFIIGNGYQNDFHQKTLRIQIPEEVADRIDESLRFIASDAPIAETFCAAWAQKLKSNVVVISCKRLRGVGTEGSGLFQHLSRTLWRHDYFSESEPVRTPSEFFGRQAEVGELLAKLMSGSPMAVFGLRKIGKSSLLGRVESLLREDQSSVTAIAFMLGNAARLKSGRWWHFAQDLIALWTADLQARATRTNSSIRPKAARVNDLVTRNKADELQLARAFEGDIQSLLKAAAALARESDSSDARLVLILDECDHLYPTNKDSGYWAQDFFVFWNTFQSIKRSLPDPSQLVFCLSGVNPAGVEQGALNAQPNPLFECDKKYLAPMGLDEVASLLSGLGLRMGLEFSSDAIASVYALVGGHPLLVRRLGSAVHNLDLNRKTKTAVDATAVSRAFGKKKRDLFNQVVWILEHLAIVAPDEERLLRDIAEGGSDAYAAIWGESDFRETFAFHLERYGLLRFEDDMPVLVLDIVREALRKPAAGSFKEQKRLLKDVVDSLEQSVRVRIRIDLENKHAPDEAVETVIRAIPSDAKTRAMARDDLLDLGKIAGLDAVLQALNWGDYEILLNKFYADIEWKGVEQSRESRLSFISQTFKNGHVVRHNNDHETKKMIDTYGYDGVYQQFVSLRESMSG